MHPSSGDTRAEDISAEASTAAIRLVFVDPGSPAATPLRVRMDPVIQLDDAVEQVPVLRPDLVLVPHSPVLQSTLATLRRHDRQLPIIVVVPAGKRSSEAIVEAIHAGATDVTVPSTQPECLRAKIIAATERRKLQRHPSVDISDSAASEYGPGGTTVDATMRGTCDAMIEVICTVARTASGGFPLLIHGEPGTGKSLTALSLHRHGPCADKAPAAVDCGQFPPEFVDRFLFEERDAYVELRQEHHGKTLIIENIDHGSVQTQRRLLSTIKRQDRLPRESIGTFPRIVMTCSTAAARADRGPAGVLDELYFELSGHAIRLPPLRSRGEDVALLIDHFIRSLTLSEPLDEANGEHRITPEAKATMLRYDWPGNVTQLRSVVASEIRLGDGAIALTERLSRLLQHPPSACQRSATITAQPVAVQPLAAEPFALQPLAAKTAAESGLRLSELSCSRAWSATVEEFSSDPAGGDDHATLHGDAIAAVEAGLIKAVLEKTAGNIARSARLLGITRVSLRRKIHSLGLQIPGREPSESI